MGVDIQLSIDKYTGCWTATFLILRTEYIHSEMLQTDSVSNKYFQEIRYEKFSSVKAELFPSD